MADGGGDAPLPGSIGQLFGRGTVAGLAEGQILERFTTHGDGTAFEALVTRHGPTVLGACRRFLRDPNDVEDAFQATFIILARKAGGLRDREAIGPWLHGVACRVARRARAMSERRHRRESPDERAIARAAAPDAGRPDLRWLLDEEILRLPDKLRLPVVLCLMEGRTYDEAAHQLRWTAGMVRGRLAEARARLRDRLVRRGEASSVALAWIEMTAPAVPGGLVASASRTTLGVVSGKVAASSAATLADGTLRRWLMTRMGTAAVAFVAAGVALGVGATGFRRLAGDQGGGRPGLARGDEPIPEKRVVAGATATPKPRRGPADSEIHPITIAGRAIDRDGRAVVGASIIVTDANRRRAGDAVLGRATSGADGRFVLTDLPLPVLPPDPGPIPRPFEGKFEVAGSAPGLAFAWHAIQSYRPTSKPADGRGGEPGLVAYLGESVVADLVFGPPARVHGRIIDDQGRPVAGSKVQFGFIDSTRDPNASGSWMCAAIDPEGGDDRPFNGIGSLPEAVRSARTDADGRYEIKSLPREAKLIALIDQDPTLEPFTLTIATSDSAVPEVRGLGHDGVLDHTFLLPRKVTVRVSRADSGRPAAGVTVLAQGDRMRRAGAIGSTDAEGRATLALPPGPYHLRAEPPLGMPYELAEAALEIGGQAVDMSVDLFLAPAATVVLEAVDADSGRGIAGAGFASSADNSADRLEVHSRASFVDHPTTDATGQLRVVMHPGTQAILPCRAALGLRDCDQGQPDAHPQAGRDGRRKIRLQEVAGHRRQGRPSRGGWGGTRIAATLGGPGPSDPSRANASQPDLSGRRGDRARTAPATPRIARPRQTPSAPRPDPEDLPRCAVGIDGEAGDGDRGGPGPAGRDLGGPLEAGGTRRDDLQRAREHQL